jgi:hypothetical protein
MTSIKISGKPINRAKESALLTVGNPNDSIVYPYMPSVNFQDDIEYEIQTAVRKHNVNNLPINGSVSLYVELYTDKLSPITGVLKNIQDALNGVAYTDDRNVSSVLIRRLPKTTPHDVIKINIIVTRPIEGITDTVGKYKDYVAYKVDVETVIESDYLPYVMDGNGILLPQKDDITQLFIRNTLLRNYHGDLLEGQIDLSVIMGSDSIDGDIDNLALTYINNLEGLLFESVSQIRCLYIKRVVSLREDPFVEIAWQ